MVVSGSVSGRKSVVMEPKRFVVKLRNPAAHRPTLSVAHGVLAAAEHVACAHRVMELYFKTAKRPGDRVVIWHQYFAAAGAVADLRARLMRYKPCELAAREYLVKEKPKLVAVFDRLVARQIKGDLPMQMCCFAQTHFWSHWNEAVSTEFVASLGFDGNDPPVIVTLEDGEGSSTGSPWIKEAWRRTWKREFGITEAKLRVMMREIQALCQSAGKMGRHAAVGILLSTGATIEAQAGAAEDEGVDEEGTEVAAEVVVTKSGARARMSA